MKANLFWILAMMIVAGCSASVDQAPNTDPVVKPVDPAVPLGRNNDRPFNLFRAALTYSPSRSDQYRLVLFGEPVTNPCFATSNFQVAVPIPKSSVVGHSSLSTTSTDWMALFTEVSSVASRTRFISGGFVDVTYFDGAHGNADINIGSTAASDFVRGTFTFDSCL